MPLITDIQQILRQARQYTINSINLAMVQAYWLIGRRIVEEEQLGESRAGYGKGQMKYLSEELRKEFSKRFSVDNLQNMRRFYITYPIQQTASVNLPLESPKPQTVSAELQMPQISETAPHKLQNTNYETASRNLQNLIQTPIFETLSRKYVNCIFTPALKGDMLSNHMKWITLRFVF